jgi:hypothetical protein
MWKGINIEEYNKGILFTFQRPPGISFHISVTGCQAMAGVDIGLS